MLTHLPTSGHGSMHQAPAHYVAWHGPNDSPDNICINFPGHDTLMFIDVVNAGWVPIYNLNLSEDVPGYMGAPATALAYPWTHFICGHLGRLATRDDVAVHQACIADIEASAREALATVDPVPSYIHYGENAWAGVKAHLDTVTDRAAEVDVAALVPDQDKTIGEGAVVPWNSGGRRLSVYAAAELPVITWAGT
jgi:hypothetical protein